MTKEINFEKLSRREREIMDIIIGLKEATVHDVMDRMSGSPGNSTVRKQLNILEDKGYLTHRSEKNINYFSSVVKPDKARASAMKHMVNTLFEGSVSKAFVSLLDIGDSDLDESEKSKILEMIEQSRKEGR